MTKSTTDAPGVGALKPSNMAKREDLLNDMRKELLVVVTGTGVTLQSVGHRAPGTEVAGWIGLLENGLQRCRELTLIDGSDAEIVAQQIKAQKTYHLIDAAQAIHNSLSKRVNERLHWMRDSIGALVVKDSRLIKSILALDGLVTTLNYDSTIHQVSGRTAIHWKQQDTITKLIRDRVRDTTLHLHGMYEHLDSIVLDRTSYDAISKDEKMQGVLHEFARFRTMLFIGCRQTFLDPNFQTLLEWAQRTLAGADNRHYILCRASEETDIMRELQPHGYLTPLVYGDNHSDLAPYLEDLATEARGAATANPPTLPHPSPTTPQANALKPADIWKLHSRR